MSAIWNKKDINTFPWQTVLFHHCQCFCLTVQQTPHLCSPSWVYQHLTKNKVLKYDYCVLGSYRNQYSLKNLSDHQRQHNVGISIGMVQSTCRKMGLHKKWNGWQLQIIIYTSWTIQIQTFCRTAVSKAKWRLSKFSSRHFNQLHVRNPNLRTYQEGKFPTSSDSLTSQKWFFRCSRSAPNKNPHLEETYHI